MDTYSLLREIADSWVMLLLFAVFVGVIFYAFRPGSRDLHDDAANVPFRHEDGPAEGPTRARGPGSDDGGDGARRVASPDSTEART